MKDPSEELPPPEFTAEEKQSLLTQIKTEVDDLKQTAQAFGVQSIKDGSWFNKFIQSMLGSYAERIVAQGGVDYFRSKYSGLTQDQVADKLISLAVRYAALAGGASGATSSAAFAATIGTAGAGAATLPAAATALVAEMLYTTRLQVRLVYDLSMIYGYPIDPSDPEDLYRTFCLAYGVSWAAGNSGAVVKAAAPEIARAKIRGLIQGSTPVIQKIARQILGPRLGRAITQKALLQAAVPVVGIGIASGWNYLSTSGIGRTAKYEIRSRALLRDAVRRAGEKLRALGAESVLFLRAMLALSTADGDFGPQEQETYDEVLRQLALPRSSLELMEKQVEINIESLLVDLRAIDSEATKELFAKGLSMLVIADGVVHEQELPLLERILTALNRPFDLPALREQARMFQRPESYSEQAARVVSSAVGSAGKAVSGAAASAGQAMLGFGKSMKSFFSRGTNTDTTPAASALNESPQASAEEIAPEEKRLQGLMDRMKQLAEMRTMGLITEDEFSTKKQEILSQL